MVEDALSEHMDVKTSLLHEDQVEEVYLEQIIVFLQPCKEGIVRYLHKSLCGLK